MTFFNGHESSFESRCNFPSRLKRRFDNRLVIRQLHRLRNKMQSSSAGGWTKVGYAVFCGYRSRRCGKSLSFHEAVGCRPIAMTIKECANNPAVHVPLERLMVRFGLPISNYLLTDHVAANMQPTRVRRPTSKAPSIRRVGFLETLALLQTLSPNQASLPYRCATI